VVTGHDKNGKSIIISDGLTPWTGANPLRRGFRSTDIWRTNASPAPITKQELDPTLVPYTLHPAPQGTVIRVSEIAPESEEGDIYSLPPDQVHEMFWRIGSEAASTFGRGSSYPFMHRTETVDYAFVIEGEITLVLDDQEVLLKAGDVAVQRGTNHGWSNRSDKVCRILFILCDGRFDPELAQLIGTASSH
jgi:quercetin dioxygenase-like cupin family protein